MEDDCRRTTFMQKKSATNSPLRLAGGNEGEKLVEEPRIVDESWCCCCTRDCWCIYNRGDDSPHKARYDAGLWHREGFDQDSRSSCNCYCCCSCCEGNYGLHPSQDDYDDDDDDDVIEFEFKFGQILCLAKLWLASAANWAKQTYIRSVMTGDPAQHRDDEVD
jgi:hypothetical protein